MSTTASVKERPVIFSPPMVRAILEGRKSVTRRVVKLTDGRPGTGCVAGLACLAGSRATPLRNGIGLVWRPYGGAPEQPMPADKIGEFCPYGKPGDRLWCRESAYIAPPHFGEPGDGNATDSQGRRRIVGYAASMDGEAVRCAKDYGVKLTPSIHMPRWASRLTLEITDIRVERLAAITEEDAAAEGVCPLGDRDRVWIAPGTDCGFGPKESREKWHPQATGAFRFLWDSINGKRPGSSWSDDPWVWVICFKRLEAS